MSAEANKALVRSFVDAVNKANISAFDQVVAKVTFSTTTMVPQGLEGLKQFFAGFGAAFPDARITLNDVIAEGDKVMGFFTFRATHKGELMGIPATGKRVEFNTMDLWRVANGKLAEPWDVVDLMSMMQQLGVIPPMGQGRWEGGSAGGLLFAHLAAPQYDPL